MVNIGNVLKRGWHILWNYKILWIFGILLALTAGGSGAPELSYQFSRRDVQNWHQQPLVTPEGPRWDELRTFIQEEVVPVVQHPGEFISTLIWVGIGLLLFIIVLAIIFAFLRYVSESAILRMVDEFEQTGIKAGFKAGWKLGWSRRAFRMWVIDLIIAIPGILFFLPMAGLGVLFFLSVVRGDAAVAIASVIFSIGCAFIFILAFWLLMVALGLLRQFFIRSAALEGTGVGESFRRGWAMFKRNWKSAALMWLVMLGIGIGFGIVSVILFLLLIPFFLILLIPALLVAAIPGFIAYGIASLFTGWVLSTIIALVIAAPFFFTVFLSPLIFITGLYRIYESNIWTLTYREMKVLDALQPAVEVESPPSAA